MSDPVWVWGVPFAPMTLEETVAAIDSLIDKLDRQILKYKDKRGDFGHDALKHQAPTA